jgi:hypothetical protein
VAPLVLMDIVGPADQLPRRTMPLARRSTNTARGFEARHDADELQVVHRELASRTCRCDFTRPLASSANFA